MSADGMVYPPLTFVAAVNAYDVSMGADPEDEVGYTAADVMHVVAETVKPPTDSEGWWIRWGTEDGDPVQEAAHTFPVTVVVR